MTDPISGGAELLWRIRETVRASVETAVRYFEAGGGDDAGALVAFEFLREAAWRVANHEVFLRSTYDEVRAAARDELLKLAADLGEPGVEPYVTTYRGS
ncbi:MAG TPA: hypothetical protein VGS12_09800 [Caulobacteraceae bacterium]|nr:hypothetical protein [Caulobacteraceae bacterium]